MSIPAKFKRIPLQQDLIDLEESNKVIENLQEEVRVKGFAPWQDVPSELGSLYFAKFGKRKQTKLMIEFADGRSNLVEALKASERMLIAVQLRKMSNNISP